MRYSACTDVVGPPACTPNAARRDTAVTLRFEVSRTRIHQLMSSSPTKQLIATILCSHVAASVHFAPFPDLSQGNAEKPEARRPAIGCTRAGRRHPCRPFAPGTSARPAVRYTILPCVRSGARWAANVQVFGRRNDGLTTR